MTQRQTAAEEEKRAPFDAVNSFFPLERVLAFFPVRRKNEKEKCRQHSDHRFRKNLVILFQDRRIRTENEVQDTGKHPKEYCQTEGECCVFLSACPAAELFYLSLIASKSPTAIGIIIAAVAVLLTQPEQSIVARPMPRISLSDWSRPIS